MSKPLILYDTPAVLKDGEDPAQRTLSPNVWRVRYALNIKGIDYRTEWVDLPDIKEHMQKLGVRPTTVLNGEQVWTVPTLVISETEAITDSQAIIDYLEKTYPTAPTLFPPGTRALQKAFITGQCVPLLLQGFPLVVSQILSLCSERGQAYFRRTREPLFGGVPIEQVELKGEARVEAIQAWVKRLGEIGEAIDKGEDAPFLAGGPDAPSNADLHVAVVLNWARRCNGTDGDFWRAIVEADGGRWARYMKAFEKFEKVV